MTENQFKSIVAFALGAVFFWYVLAAGGIFPLILCVLSFCLGIISMFDKSEE